MPSFSKSNIQKYPAMCKPETTKHITSHNSHLAVSFSKLILLTFLGTWNSNNFSLIVCASSYMEAFPCLCRLARQQSFFADWPLEKKWSSQYWPTDRFTRNSSSEPKNKCSIMFPFSPVTLKLNMQVYDCIQVLPL